MAFRPKVVDLDGLRVILVKDERESVTVQALIGSGSREETDEQAGAAHFLEHFVFKGTRKFPGVFEVGEKVDAVGGAMNAWTSQADVGFWVKTAKKQLPLAVSIVGQMVTEPRLPEKYFEKERGTIIQEYNMYEDRPSSKSFRQMWEALFGPTRVGRQVIGTLESLKGMRVSYLRDYQETWFKPANVLVGVVGNWENEKKLLDLIKKEFAGLYDRKGKLPQKDKFKWGKQERPRLELVSRKVDQAHVSLGLPGLPLVHRLRWARNLTNIILGGGNISRLFREVREKRGWAYSVGSGTEEFVDVGAVLVGGGFPKNKLKEAMGLTTEIMFGLGGAGKWKIKESELSMAKECYKGRVSLNFDKPEKVLGYAMGDLMFEGKIYTVEELHELADKVTLDEVREFCQLVFKPERLNVAVVGDYEELPFKI